VNCSVKAVETRIYRARNLLRKSLASSVEAWKSNNGQGNLQKTKIPRSW
jgi:hypothetical protein